MKKMKKLVAVLLCITCGSLAMSGCGSNSSESADGRSVIRVGTMPYYLGVPIEVISDKGLDDKYGFDMEVIDFPSGGSMSEALGAGEWDIGPIGAGGMTAVSNYNAKLIADIEYEMDGAWIIARPDSDIEGINVHAFRKESGKVLYKEAPVDADIVIGVPDSSLSAAIGYAEASHIPYEIGLVKNKYVGRTFIQPSQEMREKAVRMKLSPVPSIVKGKRIVLIDDSIVRGTTSKKIIKQLRDAGALEIHVRIASPQITHPCFYGVDISTYDELISAHHSVEEVREIIGADSLAFISEHALFEVAKRNELCTACFTGKYPTALYSSVWEANKDHKF